MEPKLDWQATPAEREELLRQSRIERPYDVEHHEEGLDQEYLDRLAENQPYRMSKEESEFLEREEREALAEKQPSMREQFAAAWHKWSEQWNTPAVEADKTPEGRSR